jgi:hypothetical protein
MIFLLYVIIIHIYDTNDANVIRINVLSVTLLNDGDIDLFNAS